MLRTIKIYLSINGVYINPQKTIKLSKNKKKASKKKSPVQCTAAGKVGPVWIWRRYARRSSLVFDIMD